MATLNIGMKVNRAISAATTVNANAYAMVTYIPGVINGSLAGASSQSFSPPALITRYFGPGQAIPLTFNQTFTGYVNSSSVFANSTITYTLQSGVELINTI